MGACTTAIPPFIVDIGHSCAATNGSSIPKTVLCILAPSIPATVMTCSLGKCMRLVALQSVLSQTSVLQVVSDLSQVPIVCSAFCLQKGPAEATCAFWEIPHRRRQSCWVASGYYLLSANEACAWMQKRLNVETQASKGEKVAQRQRHVRPQRANSLHGFTLSMSAMAEARV